MSKKQCSRADNFLRNLTVTQVKEFKERIYTARGVWLKGTTCDKLYDELVEYGLITVTPKEPNVGELNVTTDKQNEEARFNMDAKQ